MRIIAFALSFIVALAALPVPQLAAQGQTEGGSPPAELSRGQRDLGVVVLEDFSAKGGRLSFTAASGGCTDKSHFRVAVKRERGTAESSPHFVLTIERVKGDDCKALLPEGVTIEFDLEKDLGLKGDYTFAVANPMTPAVKRLETVGNYGWDG